MTQFVFIQSKQITCQPDLNFISAYPEGGYLVASDEVEREIELCVICAKLETKIVTRNYML